MSSSDIQFHTVLSPDECRARLAAVTAPDRGLLNPFLVRPQLLLGRIDGPTFRLRRNMSRSNSMTPRIEGEFVPDGSGTLVTARIRRPFSAYAALAFWLVPIAAVAILLALVAIRDGLSARLGLIALITVIFLAIASASLLYLGSSYARSEGQFLKEYLTDLLENKTPKTP